MRVSACSMGDKPSNAPANIAAIDVTFPDPATAPNLADDTAEIRSPLNERLQEQQHLHTKDKPGNTPVPVLQSPVSQVQQCLQQGQCGEGGAPVEVENTEQECEGLDSRESEDTEKAESEGTEGVESSQKEEGDEQEEGTDEVNSSSKPLPPPRSDSEGRGHRVRHMIDMLGEADSVRDEIFNWSIQREYLLACMGFVNGLGCLLQSTTLTVKHGGGVFFIAYVICMCVFGCPLVYLETTLGQYANGGPLAAWKVIPLFTGVGYCMVVITFLISTYYTLEVTWAIYYFGVAMTTALSGHRLPWDCTNFTDSYCDTLVPMISEKFYLISPSLPHHKQQQQQQQSGSGVKEVIGVNDTDYTQPKADDYIGALQYLYAGVLELPPLLTEFGSPIWYLVLCLLLTWVFIFACLIYGPTSIGKVMYMTAPYPYVALPVLFIFSCFKSGSLEGVRFFLNPQWYKLAGIQIWMDAAQLMVSTLSLGTGCLHTLAGYTHFHSHCFRNLLLICLCNVMGTMFAGFTMCSGLGILTNITNMSLQQLSVTEYELGFALYPYILTQMSDSSALSLVYFSVIIIVGLDTIMVYIQSIVGALTDVVRDCGYRCSRWRRWMLQLLICGLLFFVGLVFTTKGGLYAAHYMSVCIPRVAQYVVILLECCLLMYIFGSRKFTHNIEDMTGNKDSPWWRWNWKFVSPGILLGLTAAAVLFPSKLNYRSIPYPEWSEILGWCLSLVPLLCIPAWGLHVVYQKHGTLKQRVRELLKTPRNWGAGLSTTHDVHDVPDYMICHPDNHRPVHGLAMLTANLYIPNLPRLDTDEVPPESSSEMTGGQLSDLLTITSSDSIDSGPENEERGNWRGKLEFVLSCLGYVVGLGNIWRFPYLVYRNGGGAFFIPYLVMLVFCGLPLVFMEMAFGQYASLGPVTIWRAVPIFKGVGYAIVVTIIIIGVYYNMVNAWAFHYLFASFSSTLPWATCDNTWNTEACSLNKFLVTNCSLVNDTYLYLPTVTNHTCNHIITECITSDNQTSLDKHNITDCIGWLESQFGEQIYVPERQTLMDKLMGPSEEYFYNEVLNQSDGLQDLGPVQWQLALYLLLCWFIVFMCLVKGIYSAGKVAYIVVIIPVVLLLVLLVCALMVEGHLEGIRFYVTPQWDKLYSLKVWSDAASQVFFSLSACSGGLTTLSSYNKFHDNIYRDAILICLIDTLMSILAGFTTFASMGILANQLNTTVENVITSNIGLVFVAFPAAVTNFQPAAMWSAFFFLMILMMGLSTIVVTTETIVTVIIDEHVEWLKKGRIFVLMGTCIVLFLLGLPLTTRGGSYLLQLLDEFCGGIPTIVIGIFMCVALAWVYKVRHFCADIHLMIGRPVSAWWRCMWCVVTPIIILFILVSSVVGQIDLDPVTYPSWSHGLGILLTTVSVIAIPLYAMKKLWGMDGTLYQRIKHGCASQANWGPALIKHWKHVEYYPAVNTHTLSVDIEQSPVHAIADRVDLCTSDVRLPHLSTTNLLPIHQSPKKPQELRHKAILNHAYSNPQCTNSNGSIDQIKPRLSLPVVTAHGSDVIIIGRKNSHVKCVDASTQTVSRSYTLAIKQGSIKSLYNKMQIDDTQCNNSDKPRSNKILLEVEVTKF